MLKTRGRGMLYFSPEEHKRDMRKLRKPHRDMLFMWCIFTVLGVFVALRFIDVMNGKVAVEKKIEWHQQAQGKS